MTRSKGQSSEGAGISTRSDQPELSVLVTPTKSGGNLRKTLSSLIANWNWACSAEVVVVLPPQECPPDFNHLKRQFIQNGLKLILIHPDELKSDDAPILRGLAFSQSHGKTLVFLEDNTIIGDNWWTAWRDWSVSGSESVIASGLAEPDFQKMNLVESGVFYCEYGYFIPTGSATIRPLKRVSGNHWAVRKTKIGFDLNRTAIDEHDWVHRILKNEEKPEWNFAAKVWSSRRISLKEAFSERARQGFQYGRLQAMGCSCARCLKMMALGWAISLIHLARLIHVSFQRKYRLDRFLITLPFTVLLTSGWSLAEWAGWFSGFGQVFFNFKFKNRTKNAGEPAKRQRPHQKRIVNSHRVKSVP